MKVGKVLIQRDVLLTVILVAELTGSMYLGHLNLGITPYTRPLDDAKAEDYPQVLKVARATSSFSFMYSRGEGKTQFGFGPEDIVAFFGGLVAVIVAIGLLLGKVSQDTAIKIILGILATGGFAVCISVVVKVVIKVQKASKH